MSPLDDATFFKRFGKSFPAVVCVGMWLRAMGFEVSIPIPLIRPDVSQRMEYVDQGDIDCAMKVEVKQCPYDFTCADDFPKSNLLIGDTPKVDRNKWNTLGYGIVSNSNTHLAWVGWQTEPFWKVLNVNDYCETYGCPKRLAIYHELRRDGGSASQSPDQIRSLLMHVA